MKFLIVAGAPGFEVPGLGVEVKAKDSWFSINPVELATRLLKEGHDVTELTLKDEAGMWLPTCEFDKSKNINAVDLEDMVVKLKYLAREVQYDAIVSLVMLPPWLYKGLHSSHNDLEEFEGYLAKVKETTTSFEFDPLIRFTALDDDAMLPYTQVVYGLRDEGCDASVICLEAIPRVEEHATPHSLVSDRIDRIRDVKVTAAILDDVEPNERKRGAYVVGKNGGAPVHASRMLEHVFDLAVEAGEIAKEQRDGPTNDEDVDE